jgi:hypothetical protein
MALHQSHNFAPHIPVIPGDGRPPFAAAPQDNNALPLYPEPPSGMIPPSSDQHRYGPLKAHVNHTDVVAGKPPLLLSTMWDKHVVESESLPLVDPWEPRSGEPTADEMFLTPEDGVHFRAPRLEEHGTVGDPDYRVIARRTISTAGTAATIAAIGEVQELQRLYIDKHSQIPTPQLLRND